MRKNKILTLLLIGFSSIFYTFVNTGCANIIPPTGGAKDTIAPKLLLANPSDSTKNFSQKKIFLTFDEYVELQESRENILITPTPTIEPTIEAKLKTITISLNDSLEQNTTYFFNFGKAIKDINEGIVLNNFTYAFSTGTAIDSLELEGKVVLAETGNIDSSLIVMLHSSSEDSALIKENPRYISKLDGKGNFKFRFLPARKFYLYALKDEGRSHKYFSNTQLFAFAESPVEISSNSLPVTLFAFAEKKETTSQPSNLSQNRVADAANRRLKYTTSISNQQHDLLIPFSINFEQPLKNVDTSMLILSTDSSFNTIENYHWEIDSLRKKIELKMEWKENTHYNLILQKNVAEDSVERKLLKTDTLFFTTKNNSQYGSLKIQFSNFDVSKNPVIQFIQNNQLVSSFPLTTSEFSRAIFPPGDYELRILFDENKNGKWNAGDFFNKRKQPEIVKQIEQRITIKPDWDNEFDMNFPSK